MKGDLVQNRCSMLDEYYSKTAKPNREMKLKRALQPKKFGAPINSNAQGLKMISSVGNIGGLHVEEEDSKYFRLTKTAQLSSYKQL